ncbi:hypothetical protein [Pseudoalteromonas sp. OOF1S-7]|uniref:hypothetical protein n=1 Tax=Pseudoalteromonas sp. OOF1S-7 TaxID=2917757 RepID=UPI001EF52298|nr:hypothetical protein [Pseudoalteromonas sp. OOF1S-7]MCG7536471.1 hypothetical protein [Pseudoalteromonas sp. OOF1S-7]
MKVIGASKVALVLMGLFALSGCEGVGEEEASGDISSGSGLSSSGNSCNLQELITDADREAANACGVQASSQLANADIYYTAAVKACRSGETGTDPKTGRTTTYKDTYNVYKQASEYALNVVDQMNCGANSSGQNGGGIIVPDTNVVQHNLCVGYIDNGKKALGVCYGPVKQHNTECGDNRVHYLKSFETSSACIAERDSWVKNAFNN